MKLSIYLFFYDKLISSTFNIYLAHVMIAFKLRDTT